MDRTDPNFRGVVVALTIFIVLGGIVELVAFIVSR